MLFLGKRLLHAGLILLGVTLICYLLLFMLPADPARRRRAQCHAGSSRKHPPSVGVWICRFISNIGVICGGCCTAIWDARLFQRSEVSELVSARIGPSLQLMAAGILCELVLGIALGTRRR